MSHFSQPSEPYELQLDLGPDKAEALAFARKNRDATLRDLVRLYDARSREPLSEDLLRQPLQAFLIVPVTLAAGGSLAPACAEPPSGELRQSLDDLYDADVTRETESRSFPAEISDHEAVRVAYRQELHGVARFLANGLSVLVSCDKILTEHIHAYVCQQAGLEPILDDQAPEGMRRGRAGELDSVLGGGPGIEVLVPMHIRTIGPGKVLVLRSLDLLDNPALIQALYQGASDASQKPQLLGFLDPSLEVRKVLSDRFAAHVPVMGLPRFVQPDPEKPKVHTVARLVTESERRCFATWDSESLYKNVSGLNAVQFRNAMRFVGATLGEKSDPRRIAEVIRQFKTSASAEIEIPDTTFAHIGGYEHIKQELGRLIALVGGTSTGISDSERDQLIPRGFIFHGPPGTGKTLFAKAIANEMNATIQMVSGPEIMDKYVGQSENNLRRIFATARRNAPSVIFFDEFDSIASQRSTYADGGARANNAVVAQLLTELDGFRQEQAVIVIGTSNRIDIIDEALLRPSRLRPIEIGLPDRAARQHVAHIHARRFGIDQLLIELLGLAASHLEQWRADGEVPKALLDAICERFPVCGKRHQDEAQRVALAIEVEGLLGMVESATTAEPSAAEHPALDEVTHRLQAICRRHGLEPDDEEPGDRQPASPGKAPPLVAELHHLLELLQETAKTTAEEMLAGIEELIGEYTTDFNNDEIRAIFQEASLEHLLEGQLVTPRYLGMKIGLIRKRRDERETVHLRGRGR